MNAWTYRHPSVEKITTMKMICWKNENIIKNEVSPKPRKLSRPKKEKEVEVKKEVTEEKKTIERAANDPRNK